MDEVAILIMQKKRHVMLIAMSWRHVNIHIRFKVLVTSVRSDVLVTLSIVQSII